MLAAGSQQRQRQKSASACHVTQHDQSNSQQTSDWIVLLSNAAVRSRSRFDLCCVITLPYQGSLSSDAACMADGHQHRG